MMQRKPSEMTLEELRAEVQYLRAEAVISSKAHELLSKALDHSDAEQERYRAAAVRFKSIAKEHGAQI